MSLAAHLAELGAAGAKDGAIVMAETEDIIASDGSERTVITLADGEAAIYCAANPTREAENEDAAVVVATPGGQAVLAVADGIGGQPGGHHAARIAVDAIIEKVENAPDAPSLRSAILDGFEAANERVLERGTGSGTTLAVVEIDGTTIRPYHVGDSVILVVGQRGRMHFQSVSHSPVGYAVESGMMDEAEAIHHEERHIVSNIVGSTSMRIEIGPTIHLNPRDTLVLGSDGLFDNLHLDEIIDLVRAGPLAGAVDQVAHRARARMVTSDSGTPSKPDDLTFIIYRPSEKPASESNGTIAP